MLKKIIGGLSIGYFVYTFINIGSIGIGAFFNISGLLMFAFLAGGATLLLDLPKIVGVISGIALLYRSYLYIDMILSLSIFVDIFSILSLIVIPLGVLYFSIMGDEGY